MKHSLKRYQVLMALTNAQIHLVDRCPEATAVEAQYQDRATPEAYSVRQAIRLLEALRTVCDLTIPATYDLLGRGTRKRRSR